MAKEITGYVKLQIKGGQANPAPPVGPALGQRGINIMEFCKAFNEKMKDLNAFDLKEATKIICGSARSMGIEVKD